MTSERDSKGLEIIAARAVENLEDLLRVMQDAANQITCGRALEEIDVAGFALYLARRDQDDDQSRAQALLGVMDYEEYLRILDDVARESGLCLDELTELEVTLPEIEFGEDMVTGGFGIFKGISVERRNDCLLELMEAVSKLLERRGLNVACVQDGDVIFYLPLS
jgi:hypothetical protein